MTTAEAGGTVQRVPRTPNTVLRGIRENERHETRTETRSGDVSTRVNVALREAIWESRIELAEFARKIGVDPKTAERWITRGVVPQPFRRWEISLILGIDESELWPDTSEYVIEHVYHPETRQRGENPSGYARSLLILGLAQAGAGRIDEAAAVGKDALSGSRPAWPTMVLAGKLDQILTRDNADASDTAGYHNAYLEAASRPTAHHLQIPAPPRDS